MMHDKRREQHNVSRDIVKRDSVQLLMTASGIEKIQLKIFMIVGTGHVVVDAGNLLQRDALSLCHFGLCAVNHLSGLSSISIVPFLVSG